MPKKSTTRSGSGAQRNKPKVQKNIALVRPNATVEPTETVESSVEAEEPQLEMESSVDETESDASTITATTATTTVASTATKARATTVAKPKVTKAAVPETEPLSNMVSAAPAAETAPKGSASARLAARRQAGQKTQRTAPTLITAEHYSYVRKDLIYIAILAILMFATIIVLHFVPGIGA